MPGDHSCSVGAAHSRAVGPRHGAEDVRTSSTNLCSAARYGDGVGGVEISISGAFIRDRGRECVAPPSRSVLAASVANVRHGHGPTAAATCRNRSAPP
eukprot:105042-Prymnesium_polylepis.1